MGSLVGRILGVIGAAALLVAMFGSGVASAKDGLIGISYDEASSAISSKGGTPVVGTVTGDQVDVGACLVTNWHKSIFLDASGKNDRKKEYVFDLNCNNALAAPGKPGNSAMSPEGVKAKHDQVTAAKINKNPAWCDQSDTNMTYCQAICKRTGLCEV
ncbi:hypothetical protein [Mycobacterium sp. MMS18-G62]